jgi:hypothetical protein
VDDHPLSMAVASYASKSAAERDFGDVCGKQGDSLGHVTAAIVEKGADGSLMMDRHHCAASDPSWGGHVLGAALIVLAAPLGLRFLSLVIVNRESWVAVAHVAARFWENVPRSELHRMGDLLEARQAGIVVVSVDQTKHEVGRLLGHATARIVSAG